MNCCNTLIIQINEKELNLKERIPEAHREGTKLKGHTIMAAAGIQFFAVIYLWVMLHIRPKIFSFRKRI